MSARAARPRRIVVAGTAFGRIYLEAIAAHPNEFRIAGVLARGSDYSRRSAERYGVPLYSEVEQVPSDVDIACIVVRSGATGGPGSELAKACLNRGIHVLQEHPVHVNEITECAQAAKRGNAAYAVNTLYPNIRAVRQFLRAAEHLRSRQKLAFIDATCNSQVAYPLLDVLGRAVGTLRPWRFFEAGPRPPGQPFQCLYASFGGVPTTLRVQNQVHPDDPDNHSYLMHRVTLGCEAGVLSLAETHGPVLWNPRLHSPRDATGRLILSGSGTERLAVPNNVLLSDPEPHSYHEVFARVWPEAVAVALRELCLDIEQPARRLQSLQWALAVTQAWRDLGQHLGMPELIRPDPPLPLSIEELRAAAQA